MVVPDALLSRVNRLQQNLFISAPEISQFAAIAAFDGLDELEQTKAGYAHNRDMFLKRLPALGFKEIQPIDGAFYAYCDASDITSNTLELSSQLLDDAGVATTPGLDFDPSRGHHWLRLSFCGEFNRLSEGLDRIEQWLGDRKLLA